MNASPWLERRMRGITGTDVAAILGCHPYRSALDVWAEKTGRLVPEDLDDREDVYWGNRLESIVLDEYARRTGRLMLGPEEWSFEGAELLRLPHSDGTVRNMLARIDAPHLLCTPDAAAAAWEPLPWEEEQDELEGSGIVEAKTGNAYVMKSWAEDAPLYHQVQAGFNAAVASLSWFSMTGLLGGQRHLTYDYKLEAAAAEGLLRAADEFWVNHVLADVEPPVKNDFSSDAWKRLHPTDDGTTIELDTATWQATDAHLQAMQAESKELEKEIANIKARIRGAIGDASVAIIPGCAQYSLKAQERKEYVVKASTSRVLRRKKL